MKFLILAFVIFLKTAVFSQIIDSVIIKPKITLSPQFEVISSMLKDSEIVIKQVEKILFTHDTSLIYCKEGQYLKEFMLEELFPSLYPNDQIEYHFLNISKIDDTQYKIRILNKIDFTKWGEEYNNYFYANYIYDSNIKLINGTWKMDVSLQTESYSKEKAPFGNYIFDKSAFNKNIINNNQYKKFSKAISRKYNIKLPEKKLTYFISDRNDAFKIFGFTYCISATGMFIDDINVLINTDLNFLDKHELTHFFFSKFNIDKFLSEGVAVYEGGSNGEECNMFIINNFKSDFNNLSEAQKSIWLNNFINNRLEGGPYMPFYYACSGLLITEYLKTYNFKSLGLLMKNNGNITPHEFICQYLTGEDADPESFLLSLIEKKIHEK